SAGDGDGDVLRAVVAIVAKDPQGRVAGRRVPKVDPLSHELRRPVELHDVRHVNGARGEQQRAAETNRTAPQRRHERISVECDAAGAGTSPSTCGGSNAAAGTRDSRLASTRYSAGSTTSTSSVAVVSPPMITIASGFCVSEPMPWDSAIGSR